MGACFWKGILGLKAILTWFIEEVKTERNKLNAMCKRCSYHLHVPEYKLNFIIHWNIYKMYVKLAKKNSWIKFCEKNAETYGRL